jgi:hypothetical protein
MAITYPAAGARVDYSPFPATKTATQPRTSWLRRAFVALAEARMREAEREIARHRHLLPPELEISGNRLTRKNEDELPFGGW